MSQDSDPEVSASNAAPARPAARLVKGCGCGAGLAALGLGILITGGFDAAAWGSALIAIVIAVLVFSLSGVNGFWER